MEEEFAALISGLGYAVAWGELPQGTSLPRVVLSVVSEIDTVTLDGRAELMTGRVQADVYAATARTAGLAGRAITKAVAAHSGTKIAHAVQVSGRSLPVEGTNTLHRRSMDFALTWRE